MRAHAAAAVQCMAPCLRWRAQGGVLQALKVLGAFAGALHTACAWEIQEELTLALASGGGHDAAA